MPSASGTATKNQMTNYLSSRTYNRTGIGIGWLLQLQTYVNQIYENAERQFLPLHPCRRSSVARIRTDDNNLKHLRPYFFVYNTMLPTIPSTSQREAMAVLKRLGLAVEGADTSLSPSVVSAALGGGLPFQQMHHFAQRRSMLSQDVAPRSTNADLIAALLGRDSLREALLARHQTFANPFDSLTAAAPRFSLSQTVQQDAMVNEAFQRGREEAMLGLIRSGAVDASMLQRAAPPAARARSVIDQVAHLPAPSYTNSVVPEALVGAGIELRKQNTPYFDASSLEDPDPVILANRRTRGGVTEPFPEKMHRMLRDCEEREEADVIAFYPHGRAFTIHHVERFCREVMPRYFKQSRLSSFQRQLNLYGFTRITSGPDTGGYYHQLFLKGRPALAIHMRRVGIPKATGNIRALRPVNPGATPDFYSMAPVKGTEDDADS